MRSSPKCLFFPIKIHFKQHSFIFRKHLFYYLKYLQFFSFLFNVVTYSFNETDTIAIEVLLLRQAKTQFPLKIRIYNVTAIDHKKSHLVERLINVLANIFSWGKKNVLIFLQTGNNMYYTKREKNYPRDESRKKSH